MMTNLKKVTGFSKLASWVAIAGLSAVSLPVFAQTTPSQSTPTTPSNTRPNSQVNPQQNTRPGTTQAPSDSLDRNFVTQAAEVNLLELELGRLASQRANNNAVRQYAQRMIQDHTAATTQLRQVAADNNVTLPQQMTGNNTTIIGRFSNLSGQNFDTAYMREMIDSHVRAIALFERQSQQGQDPELKAFAASKLPALRQHLQLARQVMTQVTGQNQQTNPNQLNNNQRNLPQPVNPNLDNQTQPNSPVLDNQTQPENTTPQNQTQPVNPSR